MTEPRQTKRRHIMEQSSTSPRKLLKGLGEEHASKMEQSDPLLEEDIQLECTEAIGDILSASAGSTYHEIDQRRLPPEAPLDLKNVRVVQIAEKTRLQTTVNYPTEISLEKWFGESTHSAMDIHCKTPPKYTSAVDSMEPLKGTKPALDGTFTMSSQLAEVLLRPISSTEYLHQGHLKTFWIVGSDSTQSSESNFKDATGNAMDSQTRVGTAPQAYDNRVATQLSDRRTGHVYDPTLFHEPQLPGQPGNNDGRTEQVTQDFCNNFRGCGRDDSIRSSGDPSGETPAPTLDQPNEDQLRSRTQISFNELQGLNPQPRGIAEEAINYRKSSDHAPYVSMTEAAERLIQLTLPGGLQGMPLPAVQTESQRIAGDMPANGERSSSCMEPHCLGLMNKTSSEDNRVDVLQGMSITVDQSKNNDLHTGRLSCDIGHPEQRYSEDNDLHSPFNFMEPNRFGGAASVPVHLVDNLRATVSASSAMKRALCSNVHIPKEKTNKQHPGARASVNILKLPKDMQGRWSCERYKSAQFKLIDIMHERGVAPGRPILRPALREEARKHIGDTGLLDHLLKHMTDTVVHTGERFRRRHNAEGAMEYWLEHASLMEMRKAAGIEDPSWVPPLDWMPGDGLPGKPWELNGLSPSPSVATGIVKLNDTVESLRREMKALLVRLEGYREIGIDPNSTPENTSFMDPASSTRLHQNGFQGATPTENDIAMLNEKIKDQTLQEEYLNSAFVKRSLEAQLADLHQAVTTIQGDLHRISNILGFAAYECPGSSDEPNLSRQSTGDETCIAPTVMSQPLTPATSSICRLPGAADNLCVRHSCSSSTDGTIPLPEEQNRSLGAGTVVASRPAQIAVNTTIGPTNSPASSVLPFAAAPQIISGSTAFYKPPGNFIWPSSSHYALNQLQNYGPSRSDSFLACENLTKSLSPSRVSAMHTSPATAASPPTSNWQSNTPAETSAGKSGCMRQQLSNGTTHHHLSISEAAAHVSTNNPVLLPFPLELSMNRSEQHTMYVQSDHNPAPLVLQHPFRQPQSTRSEHMEIGNSSHVAKPIRPLPCPVIRGPVRSSRYYTEPAAPVSGWLGVGLHPSLSPTHDSDPPAHHEGLTSSCLKRSMNIMHQQKLQTDNMVAAGDRNSSFLPVPYNSSCLSLVDTETIDSAIRDHCQVLRDRNRAAQGAGRDSTAPASSNDPAAATTVTTSSAFVVQSPAALVVAAGPSRERVTTTPGDPPTLSLSLSLSLGS